MRKIFSSVIIVFVALLIFSATSVSAAIIRSDDKGTVTITKTETINDDVFINAQSVEIDGIINGDVFIGAQSAKISGVINGNLHIGAQTVDIEGSVKGNAYIGAQNVNIAGSSFGDSLLIGSQNINADKYTIIGGSLFAGAATINLDSQIMRNAFIAAGNITIGSGTSIGKDLYYADGKNGGVASISESAKIGGTIHKAETKNVENRAELVQKQLPAFFRAARVFTSLTSIISALIIGFIYLKLFSKHFSKTATFIDKSFWKSLGIGFLVTIVFIPAEIILLITVIGIPIAGLVFLILLIFSYFTKIVVGLCIGNWLSKRFSWKFSTFWTFAFGLLVYYLLRFIPFIGGLTGIVVLWVGLGALILSTFNKS